MGSLGDLFKSQETHSTALLVWRLAVGRVPPGGMEQQRGWKEINAWRRETGAPSGGDESRLAVGQSLPGGDGAVMILQVRGAWWRVMPARRYGPNV